CCENPLFHLRNRYDFLDLCDCEEIWRHPGRLSGGPVSLFLANACVVFARGNPISDDALLLIGNRPCMETAKICHSPRILVFLLWSFPNLHDFHAFSRCCLLIASHRFDTRRITSGVEKNYRDKFSRGRAGSHHARYKIPSWEDHWYRSILSPSLHV